MGAGRPLVAITRPAEQAAGLAELLRARGIEPLIVPAIRRVPPASWAGLDRGLELLARGYYAGVLFTSPAAVEPFVARGRAVGVALPLVSEVLVGAVGEGTAAALRAVGLHAAVIPPEGHGEGLAAALIDRLGPRLRGMRFLQPRAAEGRTELSRDLIAAGAGVDIVDAYRTLPASAAELAPLRDALAQHGLSAIVFASPSAVRAVHEGVGQILDLAAVSIGETTAVALQAAGYRRIHVADTPDDAALLAAVLEAVGR